MKLYCVDVAPNPTKVRLYIAEKRHGGAELAIEECTIKLMKGEQHDASHRQRNPFTSLPVLEVSDGDYIVESLSIIDYLEALVPTPDLTRATGTPREYARIRELERIADLRVLLPLARYIHATNSPLGLAPNAVMAEQAEQAYTLGLEYLDNCLADDREFVAGAQVTIADCTLAAALQFARFAQLHVGESYHHIGRWDAMYRERSPAKDVLVT